MARPDAAVIEGKAVSGKGEAVFFTGLDWVREQCLEKLGFQPFPGTLNLMLSPQSIPVVEALRQAKAVTLIPPDPAFCTARVFPVIVGTIEPIDAAIIIPEEDVRIHGSRIVEVLAPIRLKTALNIRDGDKVTIRFENTTAL
jgi:CTP-dependent riboflavin kinase